MLISAHYYTTNIPNLQHTQMDPYGNAFSVAVF